MDAFSTEERSEIMRAVRSTDTSAEMIVRRLTHRLGYRYRLHRRDLPGCPDLVFPGRRKVIFVHGCFWHQHQGCKRARRPASNSEYWEKKLNRNIERDRTHLVALAAQGWEALVVWECELRDLGVLANRLTAFLKF